jgi:hypothetical protein
MTVIAYDGLFVAADRLITNEGGMKGITRKLDVWEDWVLATSGAADHGDALIVWFKDGKKPDAYPRHHDNDKGSYLYAFKLGHPVLCFQTWPTPIIFPMDMFAAGTGNDIARTAMHLGRDAREACKIACELNIYCGEGVEYVSLSELKMTGKAEVRPYGGPER